MLRLSSRCLSTLHTARHHMTSSSSIRCVSRRLHQTSAVNPQLEQFTEMALDPRRNPLGTMNEHQVEDTLLAVEAWCQEGGLGSAESLVRRLGLELASGSLPVLSFKTRVVETHVQLIEAYIAQHQENLHDDELNDAERVLRRLFQGGSVPEVPSDTMVKLFECWLSRGNQDRAADLLMWWTDIFPKDEESLTPLYKQLIDCSFDSDNHVLTIKMADKLKELGDHHCWATIDDVTYGKLPLPAHNSAVVSSTSDQGSVRSSSMNILKTKLIEFLNGATAKDYDKVDQYQSKLLRLPEFELTSDVCEALLDFYIRFRYPKDATFWLQRLDSIGSSSLFDRVLKVFKVLADKIEDGSAWRASELFKRLEDLESQGKGVISTEIYELYCNIWVQSGDAHADKKIQAALSTFIDHSMQGHCEKAPNAQMFDLVLQFMIDCADRAQVASRFVLSRWDVVEREGLQDKIGVILPNLISFGLTEDANKILLQAKRSKFSFGETTLSAFVSAHVRSTNPISAFDALSMIENIEGQVPFVCLAHVILSFTHSRVPEAADREKMLLAHVLEGAYNGTLVCTSDQVQQLNEELTLALTKKGRLIECEKIIRLFETERQGSARLDLLTTKCFNNVMKGWLHADKAERVVSTFERLFAYGQSNASHLKPDKRSFSMCLKALSMISNSAKQSEEILRAMLTRYKASARSDLTPDDGHFNSVLIALRKESPHDVVDRCMLLLQEMKELGVLVHSFTFDTAMLSILGSTEQNKFAKVLEILTMMKESGINPSQFTHNIVINSCSYAAEDQTELALEVAIRSLNQARESTIRPDKVVYSAYVKALRHLLKNRKSKRNIQILSDALDHCRQDGALDEVLENEFRKLLLSTRGANRSSIPVPSR